MNEIDVGEAETPPKPLKKSRKRSRAPTKYAYSRKFRAKNKVVMVQHREVPEEVDPSNEALRNIYLYIVDRRTVWLPLGDVDWCIKYLYMQNELKGVGVVPGDSAGPSN